MTIINEKIAKTNNTILITGSTGTGKSYLAKKIHEQSPRQGKKFVAINLATLHENILESELFGHERGAFSGADHRRVGKLEYGNEGTIFLDEIGELTPRLQMKLLEALNNKMISPVGSNREIKLDVRIIAATNKSLESMIKTGEFREDLYYRINTFQIHLPSLAEEKYKIPELSVCFAKESAIAQGKHFSGFKDSFFRCIENYFWPGNIRELKNAIDFGIALSSDGWVSEADLPPYIKKKIHLDPMSEKKEANFYFQNDYHLSKALFEKTYLEEMLRRNEGKINLTARTTRLSKVTLIEKIRKYNIDVNLIKYSSYISARPTQ